MKTYDAIILGFGKAGKTLASEMAARGWQVAMVERSERMYGGTCINIGCIPTKALIHKANLMAESHPVSRARQQEFYRQAIASKDGLVASLRDKNYHKLADNALIEVLTGEGSFVSDHVVAVRTAEGVRQIAGRHIVINTGAETFIPPIEGLAASRRTYTSATIMDLRELPARLVVVGGGYIGLEFAAMYASFGSKVTVVEGLQEFIPREDRDIADAVRRVLENKGIELHLGTKVLSIADTEQGVRVTVAGTGREQAVEADAVLLAAGRRPATQGLRLEAAGVATDGRGAVKVDEHLRTSVPHIYAAGDVTGGLQFTYISLDDYRIIRDDLFGDGARTTLNRGPVPYTVYIDPQLSHVGLHESEAVAQGLDVRVNRIDVATIPRARTLGPAVGLLKAVVDRKTDLVLGCTLFGADSGEVINTAALAMRHGVTARELSGAIYTHPSMSESFNDLFA